MAITRRQFVTRLGALAAAAGFSQVEASKIMDAVAYTGPTDAYKGTYGKPRVVWLHGAECTGCSTSLLGINEKTTGVALDMYSNPLGVDITTAAALGFAGTLPINNPLVTNSMSPTLKAAGLSPDAGIDIADVVIDVIDLLYHETVMGMGGDLAYQWLNDFATTNNKPFVMVVEGALQATGDGSTTGGGAWKDYSSTVPWCSVAMNDGGTADIVPAEIVQTLGETLNCVAIVAIGQCATFGGYPGCKPPIKQSDAGFDSTHSQTDAMGVFDFLTSQNSLAAGKVCNVPGCPTNPWWFVLSVVALLVDATALLASNPAPLGILGAGTGGRLVDIVGGVDGTRRLRGVYTNHTVHGPLCSKYRYYTQGIFASHPGDRGCLQKIGCKGPAAHSLCTVHGWNNQQPENVSLGDAVSTANTSVGNGAPYEGGNCTRAGHPCMACTEKGYPDGYVPFVTGF